MPRTATLTFDDGSQHVYNGVPDEATPDAVITRAAKEFPGKKLKSIAGDRAPDSAGDIPDQPNPEDQTPRRKEPSAIAGIPGAIATTALSIPPMLAGTATAALRQLAARVFGADPVQAKLEGEEAGMGVRNAIQDKLPEPSPAAVRALEIAGHAFDTSKLAGLNPTGPVANAGNATNMTRGVTRGASAAVGAGADTLANALEEGRGALRGTLSPEALREAEVVRRAQAHGYTALPMQTNPSAVNSVMESVGGKIKTAQNISEKNAPVTNRLAKNRLGLTEGEAITPEVMGDIRGNKGADYEAVRNVGVIPLDDSYLKETGALSSRAKSAAESLPGLVKDDTQALVEGLQNPALHVEGRPAIHSNNAVDAISLLREKADSLWNTDKTLSKAYRKGANALEGLIERHIADPEKGFDPKMVEDFRNARKAIAQTYDVEGATNPATGNVSATAIARRGKTAPLSGELADIQDFANTQPKAVQRPEKIGGVPAGSVFDAAIATAMHGLKGLASLGIRPAARAVMASGPYQRAFVQPNDYMTPGLIERLSRRLGGAREEGGMGIRPDPNAIPFTGASVPELIAERLNLSEGAPKTFGNEIDIGPFRREAALSRAGAVESRQVAEGSRQAEAARAIPYEPQSVPSSIADRMELGPSPKAARGNEIDPLEFLYNLRLGKASAVDDAMLERAMQAEALKKRHPPASVLPNLDWLK